MSNSSLNKFSIFRHRPGRVKRLKAHVFGNIIQRVKIDEWFSFFKRVKLTYSPFKLKTTTENLKAKRVKVQEYN